MIGLGGLGAEVCKDIVLAGIKSLTIIDSQRESEENVGNRFLYFAEEIPVSHKIIIIIIIITIESKGRCLTAASPQSKRNRQYLSRH